MPQAKTQTLSLGEHWNSFIESHVGKNKRYATASELVRDSLRLLEEREANSKLEQLRQALIDGEASGDAGELNMPAIRQAARKEAGLTQTVYKIHHQKNAERDLKDIWLYTYENFGIDQADRYFDQLEAAMKIIQDNPRIGVS